jgi:hypothetical protein
MATRHNTRAGSPASAFIAALLAPIADTAEQVDSKEYQRSILADVKRTWRMQELLVLIASAEREAESLRRVRQYEATGKSTGPSYDPTEKPHFDACHALMLLPAPNIGALRWKQKCRKYDGGRPEWEEAIAADVARLEPGK